MAENESGPAAAGSGGAEGAEEERSGSERLSLGRPPMDSATTDAPEGEGAGEGDEDLEYVELVKVHNVSTLQEARLIKGVLEAAKVPCVVEDDAIETLHGFIPSQLDGIDVFVPAEHAEGARTILCAEGIVCGVDASAVDRFHGQWMKPALGGDTAARAALLAALAAENRDFRHEALGRLAASGEAGLDLARGLLRDACLLEGALAEVEETGAEAEGGPDAEAAAAASAETDETRRPARAHMDVARLVDEGRFGPRAPAIVVNDLAALAKVERVEVRRRAATALGRIRGAGAAAVLVDLLDDKDPGVRDEALESLYTLSSGETFGFDPDVDPARQHDAIAGWRTWAREHAGA